MNDIHTLYIHHIRFVGLSKMMFLFLATLFTPENYDKFLALFIASRREHSYRPGEPEVFHKIICLISKIGNELNGPFLETKEEFLDAIWPNFLKQIKRDKQIMELSGGIRLWVDRSFRIALSMLTFAIERDERRCIQPVEWQLFKLRFSADTQEGRDAASSMIALRKQVITQHDDFFESIPSPVMLFGNDVFSHSLRDMFVAINATSKKRYRDDM
jgi:hypothetical protein